MLEVIAAHPARTARGVAELVAVLRRDVAPEQVWALLWTLLEQGELEAAGGVDGRPRRWFVARKDHDAR